MDFLNSTELRCCGLNLYLVACEPRMPRPALRQAAAELHIDPAQAPTEKNWKWWLRAEDVNVAWRRAGDSASSTPPRARAALILTNFE